MNRLQARFKVDFGRGRGWAVTLFVFTLIGGLLCPQFIRAKENVRTQLDQVNQDIKQAESTKSTLLSRTAKLRQEQEELRGKLIQQASALQDSESLSERMQAQLSALESDLARRGDQIGKNHLRIMTIITGLQQISGDDPLTLLLRPGEPRQQIQGLTVIASLLPILSEQAEGLRHDLKTLGTVNNDIVSKLEEIRQNEINISTNKSKLEALVKRNLAVQDELSASSNEIDRQIKTLVQKANSLQDLIDGVSQMPKLSLASPSQTNNRKSSPKSKKSVNPTKAALPTNPDKNNAPATQKNLSENSDDDNQGATNSKKPDGIRDFPADKLKPTSKLITPVIGRLLHRYGEETPTGNMKGIQIQVRPDAQVVAPFDGKIAYAGQFLNYGQVVIVQHGGGYFSVLAGLGRTDVRINQWVLAGEPLGLVGHTSDDKKLSALYIELRKDNQTLDPMPWYDQAKFGQG